MRLKNFQKQIIVNAIKNEDQKASVYLFGSRVDDEQLGGDIDILVLSSTIKFDEKLRIKKKYLSLSKSKKLTCSLLMTFPSLLHR